MCLAGGHKKIALLLIARRVSQALLESGVERDRIQRHANVYWRRELRSHTAHALSGRTLALMGFTFNHQDVVASCGSQMAGNTRSDNAASDDDYVSCLHGQVILITIKTRRQRRRTT